MRSLPLPESVECLEQARNEAETHGWEQIRSDCRREVRSALLKNQGGYCIWCERGICDDDSHVDHIIPQSQESSKRRDIKNLGVSCNTNGTCGRRKGGNIDMALHLFPYEDEGIDALFRFLPNGKIEAFGGDAKAAYMIRHYGLNSPKLVNVRKNTATRILCLVDLSESNRDVLLAYPDNFPTMHQQLLS